MLEDAIDPRPLAEVLRQLDAPDLLALLQRDPGTIARNWNDRRSVWANLGELQHWIARSRSTPCAGSRQMSGPLSGTHPGAPGDGPDR